MPSFHSAGTLPVDHTLLMTLCKASLIGFLAPFSSSAVMPSAPAARPFFNHRIALVTSCNIWTEKLNHLNKLFLSEDRAVSKVTTTVQRAVFWPWNRPTIILLLIYCRVVNTLFEASPEICCLGVWIHYCCCGNHAVGSKPIWKLFATVGNWELNDVCLYQWYKKQLVKCCKLLKLSY